MAVIRDNKKVDKDNDIIKEVGKINALLVVKLLRPQDLLSLELRFKNFTKVGNKLVRSAEPGLMMVTFQPQAIAEEAGTEQVSGFTMPNLPARMLIGNNSRLVFKVNKPNLSLTAADLLDWTGFELVVNPRAKGYDKAISVGSFSGRKFFSNLLNELHKVSLAKINNTRGLSKDERFSLKYELFQVEKNKNIVEYNPFPSVSDLLLKKFAPPDEWETSLEIAFRLFLSPTSLARWVNTQKLVPAAGVLAATNQLFELWHTRMGTKTTRGIDEGDLTVEERLLRVLWGEKIDKDYRNIPTESEDNFLGVTSINDFYRHQIVHESSNYTIPNFVPQPVKAFKLFLTTLGATLDSLFLVEEKKLIPAASPLSTLKWRHIQTLAREHYVELVLAGNIMPFGHKAVLITITERKPHKPSLTATNFKREIVVITEPVKDYNYRDSKGKFMNFCFNKVEIITTKTPLLDSPKVQLVNGLGETQQFYIRSGGNDVQFKISGEDFNGNLVNFQMPLAFVSSTLTGNDGTVSQLKTAYNSKYKFGFNTHFNGHKVSLAPVVKNGCDTAFAAFDANFNVIEYRNAEEIQGFLPVLTETKIIEPSYQRLTGSTATIPVSLEDDKNEGSVFAKFNNPSEAVNFAGNADKTGGFAMPNFNLTGLSKAAGAFGGNIDDFKAAAAKAESYFNVHSVPDPVLFGVFKLSDILDFASGDKSSYDLAKPLLDRAPKIPNLTTEETDDAIITSYVIKPILKDWSLGSVVKFVPSDKQGFSIVTTAKVYKSLSKAEFGTKATMGKFDIELMKIIKVKFHSVVFDASPDKSAHVDINMGDPALEFMGSLSFINAFQKLIPADGFSDPPYLDVSTTGVKCGYTLAIPNLQLGVFTLANISLAADVNLPFTGAPLVIGFRFCEKQQPFTLTVSLLGGGGYFGLEADLEGLRQIEAALEFGAAVSLNLGVASGGVSIMAGIYFKMEFMDGGNSTQLTGYLRINGSMSILGLISAAIELYMAFTYLIDKQKAYGEASLSIKVEVLFFSKTVTVRTTRTFAGSGKDPNFRLTYFPDQWQEYCEAFAA